MQESRKRMSPALMEALLFLKTNSSYWNQALVSRAMNSNRSKKTNDFLEFDIAKSDNLL